MSNLADTLYSLVGLLDKLSIRYAVMERRSKAEAEGRSIWLVSPEDLILFKLLAGRPRDLGDVSEVLFM